MVFFNGLLTRLAREPEGHGELVFHELAKLPTAAVSNEQPQEKCVFRNRVHADNLTHDEKECEKSAHSHQQANAYELVANKGGSPSSEGIRTQRGPNRGNRGE